MIKFQNFQSTKWKKAKEMLKEILPNFMLLQFAAREKCPIARLTDERSGAGVTGLVRLQIGLKIIFFNFVNLFFVTYLILIRN